MIDYKNELLINGFTTIPEMYGDSEIEQILSVIDHIDTSKVTFRKSEDLFAIRQFLNEIPDLVPIIFNQKLKNMINSVFGKAYFVVKSIYFDKPEKSNWFVSYHQDLTISVDKKAELENFGPWTIKQNQFAVQPPIQILENNFTIRIHLDHTNEKNGALKVIPKSHLKGIYRAENINWAQEKEQVCVVPKGGIMIMKPLLLHASNKTTNNKKRRVIHIEFSDSNLPSPLHWSEKI
jgi:ectoine hydroxylase-related dioxygenase (phytanoyl-CoA dioxygenase family)